MNKHLIVLALIALLCVSQVEGFRHRRRRSYNNNPENSSNSEAPTQNNENSEATTNNSENGESTTNNSENGESTTNNSENGESTTSDNSNSGNNDSSTSSGSSSGSDVETEFLALHNNLRAKFGIPPLTWSATLASYSKSWSETMASTHTFHHGGTHHTGENIAYGTTRVYSPSDLFGFWSRESKMFITGPNYPHVSTTGNALDVSHYTQILWSKTTEVGCGLAESSTGSTYLTCQYSPPGNILGNPVY